MAALPWVVQEKRGAFAPLSPSLEQTHTLIENYTRDIKAAKASLYVAPRLPQFPNSEWSNLLCGRAIDLGHVLAGTYSINHEEKRTECIGQLELVIRGSKPARSVETHGQ